jgi:hypothetical protein
VFRGRHFQDELIVVCVLRYLRYSLRYRDLEELMAERGLRVDFRRSPAGSCAMLRPLANECGAISATRIGPGGWTKHTFA